jgi:hypothetical protein
MTSDMRYGTARSKIAFRFNRAGLAGCDMGACAMLHQEWNMSIGQAIAAEAQAHAICMLTEVFGCAYKAFSAKQKPRFEGN